MTTLSERNEDRVAGFLKWTDFSPIFFQWKFVLERFDQFLTLKNDFENLNFEMFEEIVHNFGKSDDDMI